MGDRHSTGLFKDHENILYDIMVDAFVQIHRMWGQRDSIVGKLLTLHMADPGWNVGIPYGPLSTERSDLLVQSQKELRRTGGGVAQKQKTHRMCM